MVGTSLKCPHYTEFDHPCADLLGDTTDGHDKSVIADFVTSVGVSHVEFCRGRIAGYLPRAVSIIRINASSFKHLFRRVEDYIVRRVVGLATNGSHRHPWRGGVCGVIRRPFWTRVPDRVSPLVGPYRRNRQYDLWTVLYLFISSSCSVDYL